MTNRNLIGSTVPTVKKRYGCYVVRLIENVAVSIVLEQILSDPEELFLRGQIVDSGRPGVRRDCSHVTVGDKAYFIKRYNCLNWRYRFRHLLRPSRALRSWRAGHALLQGGVPTPTPLLCLEAAT